MASKAGRSGRRDWRRIVLLGRSLAGGCRGLRWEVGMSSLIFLFAFGRMKDVVGC